MHSNLSSENGALSIVRDTIYGFLVSMGVGLATSVVLAIFILLFY